MPHSSKTDQNRQAGSGIASSARLQPTLAKAVTHGVDETVEHAVSGIGRFLWKSDRDLAVVCLDALAINYSERLLFWEEQQQKSYQDRESAEPFYRQLVLDLRKEISNPEPVVDDEILDWDSQILFGISKYVFSLGVQNPADPLLREIMRRCVEVLPTLWKAAENHRRGREEEPFDSQIVAKFEEASCRYALQLEPEDASRLFEPIFSASSEYLEEASGMLNWLILHQKEATPAETMWALWQRFADEFSTATNPERLEAEHSDEAKMLNELFLGANWGEARDWLPLHGETHRLRDLFIKLPPTPRVIECYAYYLAKTGTPTLPDALVDIANKLQSWANQETLTATSVFYLEEILTGLVYTGNTRVRIESELRSAALVILDALVVAGSSPAFKLRDDMLTPIAH